jgi:hypothetical protein
LIGHAVSHYDVLEVSPNASQEVVRAAYKSLMQRFHPDKNQGDEALAARAAQIVEAYSVLSDASRRAKYDLQLELAARQGVRAEQDGRTALGAVSTPARQRARPAAGGGQAFFGRGVWWMLLLAVAAGGGVLASLATKQGDPRAELAAIRQAFGAGATTEARRRELCLRKLSLLEQNPELLPAASAERAGEIAARTFVLLDAPLTLAVGSEVPGAASGGLELSLRRVDLVVGSFDAPRLLTHMVRHRERLMADLSRRLAKEDPNQFLRRDAEQQLKQIMVSAVAASLETDPLREYPSTYFECPGREAVVDLLLPERFQFAQFSALR